jgi:putative alpha-1,2-mannosidase
MRNASVFAALAAAALVTAQAAQPESPAASPDEVSPVDWVNTYIGTGGGGSDYGGTMPFVMTPFGTTNWTAQTCQNMISVSS